MAVDLHIDGINIFSPPGKAKSKTTRPIVAAGNTSEDARLVLGKDGKFLAFESARCTPTTRALAGELRYELPRTITATFRRSWDKGMATPDDEAAKTLGTPSETGTLIGPPVPGAVRRIERDFGNVRAIVAVRFLTLRCPEQEPRIIPSRLF